MTNRQLLDMGGVIRIIIFNFVAAKIVKYFLFRNIIQYNYKNNPSRNQIIVLFLEVNEETAASIYFYRYFGVEVLSCCLNDG